MNYLLDTNHWSLWQRKDPHVAARIRALPAESLLFMPVVSQAELLVGVELTAAGQRRKELYRLYDLIMAETAEVLAIDSHVAEQFARIVAQLKRAGRPIGTNDIWIAAIATAHDLTLVSNDTDFRGIDGLRVEDWTVA